MEHGLRDVAVLAVTLVAGLGPVGVLIALLNRRDRREATLLGAVCAQFSAQTVRSDIAIRVRWALLSRRGAVTVDMRACTREEVWEAIARLRSALPPHVRLRLEGTMDWSLPTRLIVEAVSAGGDLAGVDPRRPIAC